jgi:hypothetical protein
VGEISGFLFSKSRDSEDYIGIVFLLQFMTL